MKLAPFLLTLSVSAFGGDILDEIARIESGGNPLAIGDKGRALGMYQMHRGTWDDACKRLGSSWPHSDARFYGRARIVAANHLGWLQGQFQAATGLAPTAQDSYALWNLGFRGYQRRGFRIENAPRATRKAAGKIK